MKVVVIGGGLVGSFLAQILSEKNEVTIVEKEPEHCAALEAAIGSARIMCEDGCEPWVLEYAGVTEADLVIAVTGDDEDNLVASYLAKFEYDAPKVIARVNNPKNRWLFMRDWGVDVAVSASDIIAKIIEEETTLGEVVTVMKLQAGDVGLVEITVPGDALALGRSLADLELPPETLVVTVVRENAMMIPKATTVLQQNDRVLAITSVHNQDALKKVLGHRA